MNVVHSNDFSPYHPIDAYFSTAYIEAEYPHICSDSWYVGEVNINDSEFIRDCIASRIYEDNQYYVARCKNAILQIAITNKLDINVAATSREVASALIERIREAYPAIDDSPTSTSTLINFWSLGPQGPHSFRRRIAIPEWGAIEDNYSLAVRTELDDLMNRPDGHWSESGQLMLWQGQPGTGKTFALRALASSWRKWCDFHYITDPERFFGADTNYLLSVLMDKGDPFYLPDDDQDEERWRLLILEDAGELLTHDAKAVVGQALSRLLNVVDGMIGQGLRVIVLVTTNEEIAKLHPAVQRYGRCSSRLVFEPLSEDEAQAWVNKRGIDAEVRGQKALTDLYKLANGGQLDTQKVVGFA